MNITNLKIILLFITIYALLSTGCVPHSSENVIYKGTADLKLGDYCMMSGRILDKKTKKPLIGASIIIIDMPLAAGTDKSGSYVIEKIPPGTYDIKVSYIGSELFMLPDFNFEKGKYYLVDFELLESEPSYHILELAP